MSYRSFFEKISSFFKGKPPEIKPPTPTPMPQYIPERDQEKNIVRPIMNDALRISLKAYYKAVEKGHTKLPIFVYVDFSVATNKKRLYVYDTDKNETIFTTYVAHGSGSGKGVYATKFSNTPDSHMSSLGVYQTMYRYIGKYGQSRKLRGLEKVFNDKVFERAIVIHSSNYVGEGKQGNSWGCFAVPQSDMKKMLDYTPEETILVAYYPDKKWLANSNFLNP